MWRYRIGLTAVGLAVIVILRRRYAVVTVEGSSMQPTLHEGDRVLVRKTGIGQLRRGQVIVAEDPGRTGLPQRRWLIKRVAAVPGDLRPAAWLPATADPGERLVPGGKFVVLGDNRPVSYDSRQIGYFCADRLLGIAVRRMAPGEPHDGRSRSRRGHFL
jgi:signal peptidase I